MIFRVMRLFQDRFALTALAVVLIIITVCAADLGTEPSDDGSITGVITDVKITENGNTFTVTGPSGDGVRCFFSGKVNEGDVCTVTGSYSDSGTMFFVSKLVAR